MAIALVDLIIQALEDEDILLLVPNHKPSYGDYPKFDPADKEKVRQIIAQTIANYICRTSDLGIG